MYNITERLSSNPNCYLILSNNCIHLRQINSPYFDSYSYDTYKQDISMYLNKYDINNYNGYITVARKDGYFFILYKNIIMMRSRSVISRTSFKLTSLMDMLEELLYHEIEIEQMSFELKDKTITNQFQDFYKYLNLDYNKSNQWLDNNTKELVEITAIKG